MTDAVRRYSGIPDFAEWDQCAVNSELWTEASAQITALDLTPEQLTRAYRIVRRVAAVETGALEDLYVIDRGVTITVAAEGQLWEQQLDKMGERTRSFIESQLDAYEALMDLVTGTRPVSETLIRVLHEKVCATQDSYSAITTHGEAIRLPLQKGAWKVQPNNVRQPDGIEFHYCPPDSVAPEMQKYVRSSAEVVVLIRPRAGQVVPSRVR